MPPAEIADEVEMYARQHGRHASLHPVPAMIRHGRGKGWTWVVRISLRPTDPALLPYQTGAAGEESTEDVWLHVTNPRAGQKISGSNIPEPDYLPLDIEQMGPSGVRAFLERGNSWSGRGEHGSLQEVVRTNRNTNMAKREKFRAEQKELNRYEQRDLRRQRWGIPFIGVLKNIGKRAEEEEVKEA